MLMNSIDQSNNTHLRVDDKSPLFPTELNKSVVSFKDQPQLRQSKSTSPEFINRGFTLVKMSQTQQDSSIKAQSPYAQESSYLLSSKKQSPLQKIPEQNEDELKKHPLETDMMIKADMKLQKQSFSSKYNIINLVKSFFSEDLFKAIVKTISDEVIERFELKTQRQKEFIDKFNETIDGAKRQQNTLQKMLQEKRAKVVIDPQKLVERVQVLQDKLEKQSKDYYQELDIYRAQFRKSQTNGIQKELRNFFEVRLFDETDQIPPDYIQLMNQKIGDIQNQYSQYVQTQLETQKVLLLKLNAYERLKPEQFFLTDFTIDEIIEALPALEINPQRIWDLIEKHYKPNFFENVIFKKYGYLFENKNQAEFMDQMGLIREEVLIEMQQLSNSYENKLKQIKKENSEKLVEVYDLRDKYYSAIELTQKQTIENTKQYYEERELQIFQRWELERAGLMEEMKEQEKHYEHFEVQMAQEKFKSFVFRWTTLNKVNKMKKFDRDSYEYMKANLEIQEMLKVDIDLRLDILTKKLRDDIQTYKKQVSELQDELIEIRFKNNNLERILSQKDKFIDDLRMKEDYLANNHSNARDSIKQLENDKNLLEKDNQNLRMMVKSLEDKNFHLSEKIYKLQQKQNLSFLDLKKVFGPADKILVKTRLIDEINEAINKLMKKMRKLTGFKNDTRNQIVGTELRNVQKEICYRHDHGDGVLVEQSTQVDRILVIPRECQTEEIVVKERNPNKIKINNLENSAEIKKKKNLVDSRNRNIKSPKGQIINASSLEGSQQSSSQVTQKNTIQHKDHNKLTEKMIVSTKQIISSQKLASSFNSDSLGYEKSKDSRFQRKSTFRPDKNGTGENLQKYGYKKQQNMRGSRNRQGNNDDLGEDLIGDDEDQNPYIVDESREFNQTGLKTNLDETGHLEGRFGDESNFDQDSFRPNTKHNRDSDQNEEQSDENGLVQDVIMQTKQVPKVFSRLWQQNQDREEKMKLYRDQSREIDNQEWISRMAGNNSLQKTYEGMQVFKDPRTGKCFVHIDELRQRVQQSVNDKHESRNVQQYQSKTESWQKNQHQYSNFIQNGQRVLNTNSQQLNMSLYLQQQSRDNLFLNQDSSFDVSPNRHAQPTSIPISRGITSRNLKHHHITQIQNDKQISINLKLRPMTRTNFSHYESEIPTTTNDRSTSADIYSNTDQATPIKIISTTPSQFGILKSKNRGNGAIIDVGQISIAHYKKETESNDFNKANNAQDSLPFRPASSILFNFKQQKMNKGHLPSLKHDGRLNQSNTSSQKQYDTFINLNMAAKQSGHKAYQNNSLLETNTQITNSLQINKYQRLKSSSGYRGLTQLKNYGSESYDRLSRANQLNQSNKMMLLDDQDTSVASASAIQIDRNYLDTIHNI
ncbi:UNKNOWN [Stylonychia lemnae]|uniref:Uncharacterized protein n=1 Tax=Stylonychia lemnae TaxID=5949 RepID=A0A077ZNY5_STYLE|nr:UNKNOWN [Stylonychia lemnae]|eukprot:CDW71095.1 UNKNOWN [Stylonychia lemnae]